VAGPRRPMHDASTAAMTRRHTNATRKGIQEGVPDDPRSSAFDFPSAVSQACPNAAY
jgi:hypothetical protein